jgi:SAM-dependent methyltransferase
MSTWLPRERRLAFGQVADLYEATRPGYPQALVDDVVAYAGITVGEPILEVGAGTGKATRLFAAAGYEVLALEPSAAMAAVARRRCANYRSVTLVEAGFEDWLPPPGRFKLLISAQAWHWTDPQIRYTKARATLQRGGALAVFWNHADWRACPLRAALEAAYRQAAPEFMPTGPMHPLTDVGDLVPAWESEIERAEGFVDADVRTSSWDSMYTAEQYVRLLGTHSDHITLDDDVRARLFDRVATVIADCGGGNLPVRYLTRLCLARAA